MIRAWSDAAPLPPLSEKQLQAATESHEYAVANDLVLGIETDEHLQYHHSVAAAENQRIPLVERSLSDDHLPPLVIPPATIVEPWTVPRRVAAVLEAACRWLPDDELKACEEAVVDGRQKLTAVVSGPKALKLERPLLCSDHDEDYAELQRTVAEIEDRSGDRLRQLGNERDGEEEELLFAAPKEACDYAASLDGNIGAETMVVSEQTIQWLVALMDKMKWTDDDQAAFVDRHIYIPPLVRRCVSPPLPPVLSIDYFVPEGDVCLVSDASDYSSGVSELLEEAEQLLTEKTGEVWVDEAVDMSASMFRSVLAVEPDGCHFDNLCASVLDNTKTAQESELPLPQVLSASPSPQVDDQIFSAWIDESAYAPETDDVQGVPVEPPEQVTDEVPECDVDEASYETITAECLLALEENEAAEQAKIDVPLVSNNSSLAGWKDVGSCPNEMFRWMAESDKLAFHFDIWAPPTSSQQIDDLNVELPDLDQVLSETLEVDQQLIEKTASWLSEVPDIQAALINLNSAETVDRPRRTNRSEEPLVMPLDVLQKQASPEPLQQSSDPWGDLMSRFKRRKNDTPATVQDASPTISQKTSSIRAPELLIGFRAFSSSCPVPQETGAAGEPGTTDRSDLSVISPLETGSESLSSSTEKLPMTSNLCKAVISTGIPRTVRTRLTTLLPDLEFVERDYSQHMAMHSDIDTSDEADIVFSPSEGIVLATMVSLRQTDSQKRPVFQGRMARIANKYETLHVLVYRHNARLVSEGGAEDLPELSPSDAMAIAQMQGFAQGFACRVSISYIGGGEREVAQWVVSLFQQQGSRDTDHTREAYLVEEETHWELFLRQAGLNVYDAQIVLGVMGKSGGQRRGGSGLVKQFIGMPPEERMRLFGETVGCRRALEAAGRLFDQSFA